MGEPGNQGAWEWGSLGMRETGNQGDWEWGSLGTRESGNEGGTEGGTEEGMEGGQGDVRTKSSWLEVRDSSPLGFYKDKEHLNAMKWIVYRSD